MSKYETVNAKIDYTHLGFEDHGIMTFWIGLSWGGGGQGMGGYAIKGWGPGLLAIEEILKTVGVEKWEDLPGKLVRAEIGLPGDSEPPIIGHIMENRWFNLAAFMAEHKGKK